MAVRGGYQPAGGGTRPPAPTTGSGVVRYGRTPLGQALYDFGFSRLSAGYLARKYRLPIARVRQMRANVRKGLRK